MILLDCDKHYGTFTGRDGCQKSLNELVQEQFFLVTIKHYFFCHCSSLLQYAVPSSVGLK